MEIDFDKMQGLAPAVTQDADTGEVLMLGFMNREALEKTLETGFATFYSRTRQKLWTKGENSGNRLQVVAAVCPDDPVRDEGATQEGRCLRECRRLRRGRPVVLPDQLPGRGVDRLQPCARGSGRRSPQAADLVVDDGPDVEVADLRDLGRRV